MLASFAVSFLAKFLLGWIDEMKQSAGDRETGRLRSELDHALEVLKQQEEMAQIAARPFTREGVLARFEEGKL